MSFISKLANNVESLSRGALETAGVIKRGSLTAVELDTLKRRRIDLTVWSPRSLFSLCLPYR